ncbi:MAG: long-chain fatty acid--CoA ligase [Pseudomonadota bacterium]|nr:long-chain fatty acid--CoA ligase [Pseudomonadota bacterium]
MTGQGTQDRQEGSRSLSSGKTMSVPEGSVVDMFAETVARHGSNICTEFLGKKQTYRQISNQIDRLARGLQGLGIGKGSRVGLFLPNCPAFVVAYYAILETGATVVNFNPLYVEREIAAQIQDSGLDTMITLDLKALYNKLENLRGKTSLKRLIVASMADMLPFPKSLLFRLLKRREIAHISRDENHLRLSDLMANDGQVRPVTINPKEDVAVLQYTGGTTGVPKGAMLTHTNLRANAEQAFLIYTNAEPGNERILCVIPFFHVFAMTAGMNMGIRLGAEMVLLPRFELENLIRAIDRTRPTLFPAVPTIYTAINLHKRLDRFDLRSIRLCVSGGAPLPVEVKLAFEKNTGSRLVEGYGLTEASPVVCCNPADGINKTGSIGLPLPGTTVSIRSLEDPHQEVPRGEKGELCVKGPQVMKGYWNRPEETERVFVDGFLRTGDVARIDEDGYVFIVDRIKDVIIAGGYKIWPRNVEEAVYLHSAVAECLVIGVPDTYRGQSVKLFVRLKEGQALTAEALKEFLQDKLSPIEMPRAVEFRDSLPKTLIGKLDRKALRKEEGLE